MKNEPPDCSTVLDRRLLLWTQDLQKKQISTLVRDICSTMLDNIICNGHKTCREKNPSLACERNFFHYANHQTLALDTISRKKFTEQMRDFYSKLFK